MIKKLLFGSLFLLTSFIVNAQSPLAKNAVYLELAGNGGAYSVNIERSLSQRINARIGFASWKNDEMFGGEEKFLTIPVMLNSLFGQGSHKLDVGAGVLLGSHKYLSSSVREESKESIFNLTGVVGYRYQKPSGGILFRGGLTPFLDLSSDEEPYPASGFSISGGVSVGYAF